MRTPHDPALPHLAALLEPDAIAPVLERSLGRSTRFGEVGIARIAWKPGTRAVVHYEVRVDGRVENAVAFTQADRDLEARARSERLRMLARQVNGRSPSATPAVYDADTDSLVTWLPLDPGLRALVEPPRRLAERLAKSGVMVPTTEPALVPESYKPGARIVLRLGQCVLKAYGTERSYERGVAGFRLAASAPLTSPGLAGCIRDLRVTAQSAVDGTAPTPEAGAAAVGALVRRLQAAPLTAGRTATTELILALVSEKAELVGRMLPELRPTLVGLCRRLRNSMPRAGRLVPAHGDFDADQLILTDDGELVVIDFDDACLASPALDLATYLADVVRGGERDLEALAAVREPLLAGYGTAPPALDWYLAAVIVTRAPQPFQRARPAWPERVERMVRTAGEVLAA